MNSPPVLSLRAEWRRAGRAQAAGVNGRWQGGGVRGIVTGSRDRGRLGGRDCSEGTLDGAAASADPTSLRRAARDNDCQ